MIATGARAIALPIEGIEAAGYLTNETVFNLTERPRRFGVIGAGPIGCELAQAFRRLGSEVIVLHADPHILPREDEDAARIVEARFAAEGIRVVNGAHDRSASSATATRSAIHFAHRDGRAERVVVDELLLGVGRAPNVEGLDLETVGVRYDARARRVRERLSPDQQPAHLRRRRHLHEVEVHARGRRGGQDRGAERAVRAHARSSPRS